MCVAASTNNMKATLSFLSNVQNADQKNVLRNTLDLNLNIMILQASLHGKSIFPLPKFTSRLLSHSHYLMDHMTNWTFKHSAFIGHGDSCYSVFIVLMDHGPRWEGYILASTFAGGISTLLVDLTIIWRCWTIWDCQWKVVFIPMFCVVAATGMKTMEILTIFVDFHSNINKKGYFSAEIDWMNKIIEMLIESLAMYSLSLIIYLAFLSKNSEPGYYADIIAAYAKPMLMQALVEKGWLLCWRTILPWLDVLGKRAWTIVRAHMMAINWYWDLQWERKLYDLHFAASPIEG
ncbi:hypothetical protein EDD18DRAFT_1109104 [Armillaria luteobubalina]|uniref:Uncharacterized protein n=1 Tax=Armillaria luteobubalina TaxID=153913 RepID=A0AA39PY93_9AGAR|nr:hypothetical protein EDD18DRAFT_1109104 [Armillaria luteobubalina]